MYLSKFFVCSRENFRSRSSSSNGPTLSVAAGGQLVSDSTKMTVGSVQPDRRQEGVVTQSGLKDIQPQP